MQPQLTSFFDDSNRATTTLQALLELTGIQCDLSLKSVVQATQLRWLNRKCKYVVEHGELVSPDKQANALSLFGQLGMVESAEIPTNRYFDYAILYGSNIYHMALRWKGLLRCLELGCHIGEVFAVCNNRPLEANYFDSFECVEKCGISFCNNHLSHQLHTESDVLQFMADQIASSSFAECIMQITVANIAKAHGLGPYPNTLATLLQLGADYQISPGSSILGGSTQPFRKYQEINTAEAFPNSKVVVIGLETLHSTALSPLFDAGARTIHAYEQSQLAPAACP